MTSTVFVRNLVGMFAAIGIVFAAIGTASAEKFEQTSIKKNPRILTRSAMALNDVANHEIGQEIQLSDIKFTNLAFKVKEEWVYNQFDFVGGTGPHRGSFVDVHEDGNQTFGTYEGSQRTSTNSDGSWKATWEGTYKYTGGTGKFKNIKGHGTYKGSVSSNTEFLEEGWEKGEY